MDKNLPEKRTMKEMAGYFAGKLGQISTDFEVKQRKSVSMIGIDNVSLGNPL
jgi:hypothetical protein